MKSIIHLIAMMIWISSCSTYVPVKKVLPPELSIPERNADFLFLSHYDPSYLTFNNDNKIEVYHIGYESYLKGIENGFDTSRYYHISLLDTTFFQGAPSTPVDSSIAIQTIKDLCAHHEKDYLVTLDAYDLFFDQEVEVVENEDGSKDRTAYYDLVARAYLSIYDKEGGIFDKARDERRVLYDERSVLSGLLAIGPSMGKADEEVIELSKDLGNQLVQKFYPVTVVENREFFHTKQFQSVYKDYLRENWRDAETKLLYLAESNDTKIAGRASYNLSVLYENLGRIDEMEYWYGKAKEYLGSSVPAQASLY